MTKRPNYIGQAHRPLASILHSIAILPEQEQAAALRQAPRSIQALCYFAYGPFNLNLPTKPMKYIPITTQAYARREETEGDSDLLAAEAHKLVKLFAVGGHPTLTTKRRLELWVDIMMRINERELMDEIRMHRKLPVSREVVKQAWPGLLDKVPTYEQAPQAPTYQTNMEPYAEIPSAPQPAPEESKMAGDVEHARRTYERLYSKLKFG